LGERCREAWSVGPRRRLEHGRFNCV